MTQSTAFRSPTSIAIGLVILLTCTTGVIGDPGTQAKAVIAALRFGDEGFPPDARLDLAEKGLTYWKYFDGRIPRNSPADEQWIDEELDTTDDNRLTLVLNSEPYARRELVQHAADCVFTFSLLPKNIGSSAANELYLWLKITRCYSVDLGFYLRKSGVQSDPDGDLGTNLYSLVLGRINGPIANAIISGE